MNSTVYNVFVVNCCSLAHCIMSRNYVINFKKTSAFNVRKRYFHHIPVLPSLHIEKDNRLIYICIHKVY